jgi:hypothetical protein
MEAMRDIVTGVPHSPAVSPIMGEAESPTLNLQFQSGESRALFPIEL